MRALILGRVRLLTTAETPPHEHGRLGRRLGSALDTVTLAPPGLPPSAILVVRRLADPLPGGLIGDRPLHATQQWGAAARSQLAELWRTAARPAHARPLSNVTAVWFADMAEWLACLSWDLHCGIARQHWWWETWLRVVPQLAPSQSLPALWREQVRWLPAATALLLEQHGMALLALVRQIGIADRSALQQALAEVYLLPTVPDSGTWAPALRELLPPAQQTLLAPVAEQPEARFLTLLLALQHAPARVRSRMRQEPLAAQAVARPPATSSQPPGPEPSPDEEAFGRARISSAAAPPVPELNARRRPAAPPQRGATPTAPAQPAYETPDGERAAAEAESPPAAALPPVTPEPEHPPVAARIEPPSAPIARAEPVSSPALEGIVTRLGGAWYLVNVLVELELFDGPASPWLTLAALAEELFGAAPPDPLWAVLAELAGLSRYEPDPMARQCVQQQIPQVQRWLAARYLDWESMPGRLQQPAQLFVTRTHIDVCFGIEQIDLAIRRAGLDRDPGWVPELARVVAFHFDGSGCVPGPYRAD